MSHMYEPAVQTYGGVFLWTYFLLLVLPQEHVTVQPIEVSTVPDVIWTLS